MMQPLEYGNADDLLPRNGGTRQPQEHGACANRTEDMRIDAFSCPLPYFFAALYPRRPGPAFGQDIGVGVCRGKLIQEAGLILFFVFFAGDELETHAITGGVTKSRRKGRGR